MSVIIAMTSGKISMTSNEIGRILGSNLRAQRHDLSFTLADVSKRSGLSISYISEMERGLKFPGADTLASLTSALQIPIEDLFKQPAVTENHAEPERDAPLNKSEQLDPVAVLGPLAPIDPLAAAVQTPHLRSRLNAEMAACGNRLADVEQQATAFLSEIGRYAGQDPLSSVELEDRLLQVLRREYGVTIDTRALSQHSALNGHRSVSVAGRQPGLFINSELLPSQRAFILAKEIGSFRLGTKRRTAASPWLRVPTWREVRDNHATSYFAGAVLLPEQDFVRTMTAFLSRDTWSPSALLQCMNRFSATPEMFFYRIGQVAAAHLGLSQHVFMRLSFRYRIAVSRLFNMTALALPHVLPLSEHVCRRWAGLRMLHSRAEERAEGFRTGAEPHAPTAHAQRVDVQDGSGGRVPLLVLAMSRPLQLGESGDSAVMMGIPLSRQARSRIRFSTDRRLVPISVGTTCERCPITNCDDRQAPPLAREITSP